jgi:ferredoxin
VDRAARRIIQLGFLLLFLYPLAVVIYQRVTFRATPSFASWLLLWDPLLLLGHLAQREWPTLVIGAPLFLAALTVVLGRFFCGWVCPIGAVLDLIQSLAFWRRRGARRVPVAQIGADGKVIAPAVPLYARLFPRTANSPLRYYILIAVLVAGIFSLQALGLLDPLVIFHRTVTTLASNFFTLRLPPLRAFFSVISLVFLGIVLLELWQPRFWCRNLCPLGALIGVFSRFSLLNRQVSNACTLCGDCHRTCAFNAIPRKEPHNTDYTACTFCLECESICPNTGISFTFGSLAGKQWQRKVERPAPASARTPGAAPAPRFTGSYVPKPERYGGKLTRRELLSGVAAGVAGVALVPTIQLDRRGGVLRPPGALPEDEFIRTCILCQECVRVCPTGGLKPIAFGGGLARVGTPHLVPRVGACTRNPNCPHLCAQACPVGAIKLIPPEDVKIGRAVVDRPLCLAWDQQVKCLVCVEACLVEAAQMYNGRIIVNPTRCTGCGRCENACPVAGGAIHVKPLDAL